MMDILERVTSFPTKHPNQRIAQYLRQYLILSHKAVLHRHLLRQNFI